MASRSIFEISLKNTCFFEASYEALIRNFIHLCIRAHAPAIIRLLGPTTYLPHSVSFLREKGIPLSVFSKGNAREFVVSLATLFLAIF